MKDQFQINSHCEGTSLQAELFFFSCSRDKNRVMKVVVVHFVQLYYVNALWKISIQCLQIHSKWLLFHISRLLQCLDEFKSIEQLLKL